jgi:hypothetical protein
MKKEWCTFSGRLPYHESKNPNNRTTLPILTMKKKVRCPVCGKRLQVVMVGCQCCMPQSFVATIARHKRKGK